MRKNCEMRDGLPSGAKYSEGLRIWTREQISGHRGGRRCAQVGEIVGFHHGQNLACAWIKQLISGIHAGFGIDCDQLDACCLQFAVMAGHQQQDAFTQIKLRANRHLEGGVKVAGKGVADDADDLANFCAGTDLIFREEQHLAISNWQLAKSKSKPKAKSRSKIKIYHGDTETRRLE